MRAENIAYNRVLIRWRLDYQSSCFKLFRLSSTQELIELYTGTDNRFIDTVPGSLNEDIYHYVLKKQCGGKERTETVSTMPADWCAGQLPRPYLPLKPEWIELYNKAWQLAWQSIVHADRLPYTYAYNDYPDNQTTYVWDSCFCTMYQRYAAQQGVHPCMATLDSFYALQQPNGYIARNFNCNTFRSWYPHDTPSAESVNPPLFAWAEWEYYLVTADRNRLVKVLPALVSQYRFFDGYMQKEKDKYAWSGDGNGWDNINWGEGDREILWYVDALCQQALAARHIALIAGETAEPEIAQEFSDRWQQKSEPLHRLYWSNEKKWFCSLDKQGRHTRKTLCGIWALIAGIARKDTADMVATTLMDPSIFYTSPMPLPALAKDEPGYNPHGEYWLGGVWINMVLVALRGLREYGYAGDAFDMSQRTLDGISAVFRHYDSFPGSLWECYAPEFAEPASHKNHSPGLGGGVREEFSGWTGCLINLIIEEILGFHINAPANVLVWDIRLNTDHGIDNLRFGGITTSLRAVFTNKNSIGNGEGVAGKQCEIHISSNSPYHLQIHKGCLSRSVQITPGTSDFFLALE
jgi:hypothetical protein